MRILAFSRMITPLGSPPHRMKSKSSSAVRAFWLGFSLVCCSFPLRAEQFGLFSYKVIGGANVEIVGYPQNASGSLEIPQEIAGRPVTSIGDRAFQYCYSLTSVTLPASVMIIGNYAFEACHSLIGVTIPASVTSIGDAAFYDCYSLTSIAIPAGVITIGGVAFGGCRGLTDVVLRDGVTAIGRYTFSNCVSLTSISIPPSVTEIGDYALSGCSGLTSVTIPASVTSLSVGVFTQCSSLSSISIPSSVVRIAEGAFSDCTGLSSVTIPASVTSIGAAWCADFCTPLSAFPRCTNLTTAVFLGDSPYLFTPDFEGAAPGFTIYYLSDRAGFTSPTWNGHPTIMIDKAVYPAASWLLKHGLWYDTDLNQDPDGDGVSHLMAYALDLDPSLNLRSSLPVPVLDGNTLSLSFHAASPGISYRVETSADLKNWTTTGVTQSVPGADQRSIATVPLGASSRFLRLAVEG